jgi:hypothetical protein
VEVGVWRSEFGGRDFEHVVGEWKARRLGLECVEVGVCSVWRSGYGGWVVKVGLWSVWRSGFGVCGGRVVEDVEVGFRVCRGRGVEAGVWSVRRSEFFGMCGGRGLECVEVWVWRPGLECVEVGVCSVWRSGLGGCAGRG